MAVLFAVASATLASGIAASAAGRHSIHTYATGGTLRLQTGLFDPYSFVGASKAYGMAQAAGASYVRLIVHWNTIAPAKPSTGFIASDPDSAGYSWSGLDRMVTAVEAAGVSPIIDVVKPPTWAYAVRPRASRAGTPQVSALRSFARALATHYDGEHGAPKVYAYQVWNEPNLSLDLYPVKASTYRKMVNAVAASVHAVDRKNLVVAGGLDPFGNKAKRFNSISPLAYMRALLCLSKGKHPHRTCNQQIHFDAWSHHPYTFGGPFGHAQHKDDVSLGDLPKMRALLRAGTRLHRIVSSHPVHFWVTEFGWDTAPPRHHAAPMSLAARWTAESMYQMWRSGVSLVTWFLLQDRGGKGPYQSGLYFHSKLITDARAKPIFTAFRFPFVAYLGDGNVMIWGRDATSTKALVTISRRHGHGSWRPVARIRSNRYGIFKMTLKLRATKRDWLRATAPGSGKSLAFSLTVPKHKRYGPWGN